MRKKLTSLLDWLKSATDEDIAITCTTRGHLRQIAYGNRPASPETAARIELASAGIITRQKLRPDDWHVIWPELRTADNPAQSVA